MASLARVDQITNAAGTGPVEFPLGVTGVASSADLATEVASRAAADAATAAIVAAAVAAVPHSGSPTLDQVVGYLNNGTVNPAAYAVVLGTGLTQIQRKANRAAMATAISAALAAHVPLQLPPGTLQVELDAVNVAQLITDDLIIRGAGREQTILQVAPDNSAFAFDLFRVTNGKHLELRDLTIAGPGNAGMAILTAVATTAVNVLPGTLSQTIRLRNVTITGRFNTAILTPSGSSGDVGDTLIDIDGCDIAAWEQAVSVFAPDAGHKRLHIRNSTLASGVSSAETGGPWGHIIYIHPHCSLDLRNVTFQNNFYFAIHQYSSSGTQTTIPKYLRLSGCLFDTTCAHGILGSTMGRLDVQGGEFRNTGSAVWLRRGAKIQGTTFAMTPTGGTSTGIGMNGATATLDNEMVQILGCHFDFSREAGGSINMVDIGGTALANWRLANNTAYAITGNLGSVVTCNPPNVPDIQIRNLDVLSAAVSGTGITGLALQAGTCRLSQSTFKGYFNTSYAAVRVSTASAIDELTMDDCTFDTGGTRPLIVGNGDGTGALTVRGRGNYFKTGDPRAIQGATFDYQNFRFREGLAPTAIASTGNMTIGYNYDTYHISGTATINRILVNGAYDQQMLFHGAILRLIADAAWSLSAATNIVPRITTPRTAGEVVQLIYDANLDTWYETW